MESGSGHDPTRLRRRRPGPNIMTFLAELIQWLREHAVGDYRPCADAADVLESQAAEIDRLQGKGPGWWEKPT